MSGIPTWQAATTYVPGSLVVPSSSAPVAQIQPTNPGFETGTLSGWTAQDGARWAITTDHYYGTYGAKCSGNGLTTLDNNARAAISVGQSVTASIMMKITNAGTDDAYGEVVLMFYDAGGVALSTQIPGGTVTGVGGYWHACTASGAAPSGAASFSIRASINPGSHGSTVQIDAASFTYSYAPPPAGIVYKATQAAPGKSGASEPVWPAVGSSVTDNQVTWQGEYATRLVWQASPILQSGATEPTWPTQAGGAVRDGTIDWTARSAQITDPNCPQSKIVAIGAGKIFAADNDIVRYCATVNPLDWSAPNDAGYLPTGLQTYGSNPVAAMGLYRSNLVVYNAEGFQMWQLDPDPANIALLDALPVASTHNPALAPTANDLFFLSSQGVRSMGISATGVNLEAGDVGMPVDALVKPSLAAAITSGVEPIGAYIPAMGQYWLSFAGNPFVNMSISGALSAATIGIPYVSTLSISGGNGTYCNPRVIIGTLPAWATLSIVGATLQIAGTPTGSATVVNITLAVDSGDGQTVTNPQTLNVLPAPAALDPAFLYTPVNPYLTNNNLTLNVPWAALASGSGTRSVRGTATGKFYFEVTMQASGGSIGVYAAADGAANQPGLDSSAHGVGYRGQGYVFYKGSLVASGFPTFTNGDVIGCAVDAAAGKVWWRKNGTWLTGDPSLGTLPTTTIDTGYVLYPGFFLATGASSGLFNTSTINLGGSPYANAAPTGFGNV